MVKLNSKGVILYDSESDYIASYESELSINAIFLETDTTWPLLQSRVFQIQIAGIDLNVSITAEPVFDVPGKVGLEIEKTAENSEAINRLLEHARGTQDTVLSKAVSKPDQSEPLQEAERATDPTVSLPPAAFLYEGEIVSSQSESDFISVEPTELGSDLFRSIKLLKLIASISASGHSLELLVFSDGGSYLFHFNDLGNLVHHVFPGSAEDLLDRLVQKRLLQESRKNEVLGELQDGGFVEKILLERKLIKIRNFWVLLRDQAIDSLEKLRSVNRISYQLRAKPTKRRAGVTFGSLMVPWMERALVTLDLKKYGKMLEPMWDKYLMASDDSHWSVESFTFDSKSKRFVDSYLDGNSSLTDVLSTYPIRLREKASYAVALLTSLGVLKVMDQPLKEDELTPEMRLEKLLEGLKSMNKFFQAGVHWSAHCQTYPMSMKSLKRKFGPDSILARTSDDCARLCKIRVEMAAKAQEYLMDPKQRNKYRKQVIGDYHMKNAAELLFRQAQLLLMKNEVEEARKMAEVAFELRPLMEYKEILNQS